MSAEKIKMLMPFFEAMAKGRAIQRLKNKDKDEWEDLINIDEVKIGSLDPSQLKIKPREFKNFKVPWEFIEKRWNFATYAKHDGGMILYEKEPTFREEATGYHWRSDLCMYISIRPIDEEVDEINFLAARDENATNKENQ